MANVMKIKYADATLKQLAKAKAQEPHGHFFLEGKTYEEILHNTKQKDRFEHYKSYDQYGRLTPVGKAKRLQDLKDHNLSEISTIQEYFAKLWEEMLEWVPGMVKQVERKFNKHPYGPL